MMKPLPKPSEADGKAPYDGKKVFLYDHGWDAAKVGYWEFFSADTEEDSGCAWVVAEEYSSMGDGVLWIDEDAQPTMWMEIPEKG
jgi:hypothetical protein